MSLRAAMALLATSLLAQCAPDENATAVASATAGGNAASAPRAAILIYHHVATDTPPSTSVTPQAFAAHLHHLVERGYEVLPLAEVLSAIQQQTPLPANTVVITFDDAYRSVYTEALPQLERHHMPFTVFVTTDPIDGRYASHLSWDLLRDIEKRGGTIANHSKTHAHFVRRQTGETESQWRQRITNEIVGAQSRLEQELENPLRVLAYPYGEFDADVEALARELGYAALGQQSGPAGPSSGLQQIPRFPVATGFDDLASLTEKLDSLPLPVTVLRPERRTLGPGAERPTLEVIVGPADFALDQLGCFVSGQGRVRPTWLDRTVRRLTVRAEQPLPPGRSKYTCTAPATGRQGTYYWYSYLWLKPRADGSWYDG